jgi:4-methyl-5(b-hydroxyethyl)-thiazole monophosphate biosynthesis
MSKKILVPIANGTEEIEAVCIIDVLRRAEASVTVASVDELQVTASRGVKLVADKLIGDCVDETYDLVVLPGGMPGAEHLRDSKDLQRILKRQKEEGKLYGTDSVESRVVVDGTCVTSRGPGTALEFALKLVELLYGKEKAEEVASPMVM